MFRNTFENQERGFIAGNKDRGLGGAMCYQNLQELSYFAMDLPCN